jgi:hypothetical protein
MQVSVRVPFSSDDHTSSAGTTSTLLRGPGNNVRRAKKPDPVTKTNIAPIAPASTEKPAAKPALHLLPKAGVNLTPVTCNKANRGNKGRKALMRGSCGW